MDVTGFSVKSSGSRSNHHVGTWWNSDFNRTSKHNSLTHHLVYRLSNTTSSQVHPPLTGMHYEIMKKDWKCNHKHFDSMHTWNHHYLKGRVIARTGAVLPHSHRVSFFYNVQLVKNKKSGDEPTCRAEMVLDGAACRWIRLLRYFWFGLGICPIFLLFSSLLLRSNSVCVFLMSTFLQTRDWHLFDSYIPPWFEGNRWRRGRRCPIAKPSASASY